MEEKILEDIKKYRDDFQEDIDLGYIGGVNLDQLDALIKKWENKVKIQNSNLLKKTWKKQ